MKVQWQQTSFPGVRFYEHPTRKHGVSPDKNFFIRYKFQGKRHEEPIGWTSESWTARKAANELAELKKNHTTGEGPVSLAEKRELEKERRDKVKAEQLQNAARDAVRPVYDVDEDAAIKAQRMVGQLFAQMQRERKSRYEPFIRMDLYETI